MTPDQKYLVDTDVFVRVRHRKDSEVLYAGIIDMASAARVRTVRQVFDELEGHGQVYKILFPHKSKFVIAHTDQYCDEVGDHIERLGNEADYLWQQQGGKNPDPADPWLISVAAHQGYTLVTNESRFSAKRIPAACKLFGTKIRCISGPHFLFETGLVTQIKPEHISVEAFFRDEP